MAKVILICGKICSGKTYYANEIKKKEKAVVLSTDEVTYDLTNNVQGNGYEEFANKVNTYLKKKTVELVNVGCNVILDWGFWTQKERKKITDYFSNHNIKVEWHYIDIEDSIWYKNIADRNEKVENGNGGYSFYVDEGLLKKVITIFEIPKSNEIDVWYTFER